MLAAPSTVAIETGVANHNQRRPSLRQHMDWLGERSQENQESRERRRGGRTETPIEAGDAGKLKAATRASTVVPGKKIPTAKGWDFDRWWTGVYRKMARNPHGCLFLGVRNLECAPRYAPTACSARCRSALQIREALKLHSRRAAVSASMDIELRSPSGGNRPFCGAHRAPYPHKCRLWHHSAPFGPVLRRPADLGCRRCSCRSSVDRANRLSGFTRVATP